VTARAEVLLLGTAPLVRIAARGLRAHGAGVTPWTLPAGCPAATAAALAAAASRAPYWADAAGSPTVISLWTDQDLLDAVARHVLPGLAPAAQWLQLGPHGVLRAAGLEAAVRRRGGSAVHAQLNWDLRKGRLYLRCRPRALLLGSLPALPVRAWVESLPDLPDPLARRAARATCPTP